MVWNVSMDELLLREVLLYEPYQYKRKTTESGNAWKAIANTLLNCEEVFCSIDTRATRERFNLILSKRQAEVRSELKATGISPDETEKSRLLDEIIDQIAECERTLESKATVAVNDKKIGENVRLLAMESFGESRKRKAEENGDEEKSAGGTSSKRGRTSNETLNYLKEIAEQKDKKVEEDLRTRNEQMDFEREKMRQDRELREQEIKNQRDFNIMMMNQMQAERQAAQQQNAQLMAALVNCMQNIQQNNNN